MVFLGELGSQGSQGVWPLGPAQADCVLPRGLCQAANAKCEGPANKPELWSPFLVLTV